MATALTGTNPQSENFMQKSVLQPLADLAGVQLDDAELELARHYFVNRKEQYCDAKAIAHSTVVETMPSVKVIFDLSRTIAVSTSVCESSFSCLKRIVTPHRLSMLHKRKADLILISFERQLAIQVQCDGQLLRRFWESGPDGRRRLQLF